MFRILISIIFDIQIGLNIFEQWPKAFSIRLPGLFFSQDFSKWYKVIVIFYVEHFSIVNFILRVLAGVVDAWNQFVLQVFEYFIFQMVVFLVDFGSNLIKREFSISELLELFLINQFQNLAQVIGQLYPGDLAEFLLFILFWHDWKD